MRWKKNWYLVHRWLGLIVGLQLLAWSIGGFAFSIMQIKSVRGETDMNRHEEPVIDVGSVQLSPAQAVERASTEADLSASVQRIVLRTRRGHVVYELIGADDKPLASVNAANGDVTRRISEREAEAAAVNDFATEVTAASIEFLEGEPPPEFRRGRMPVYRVDLDHPKQPHIYVCPVTGEVLTRRNNLWRIFDFFWMLHIMDYGARSNFNHPLLTGMSALAILTSASGLILWWWRIPRLTGRADRKKAAAGR